MKGTVKLDCKKLTYQQMADIISLIANEVKERNPIFVNSYLRYINQAIYALEEISGGEKDNFTSESGPLEI